MEGSHERWDGGQCGSTPDPGGQSSIRDDNWDTREDDGGGRAPGEVRGKERGEGNVQGPLRQGWGDMVHRHHGREENEASLGAVFTIPAISVGSSGPSALEKLVAAPSHGDSKPATQKD